MRKFSAASVPPIFMNLTREQEDEVVYCHGTTAKLHARSGVFDDERLTPRARRQSLMPPIPSARSSASSKKSSSSSGTEGYHPNTPQSRNGESYGMETGLHVIGETGYLESNSRKKSDAEKLSDTGFDLYTLEDRNKLPKILRSKKKGKGKKRKKMKDDQDNESDKELKNNQLESSSTGQSSPGENDEDYYNRYGLDPRHRFNLEMTRPFTYSYFPKIYVAKKNGSKKGKNNDKLRKISKTVTRQNSP